MNHIGTQTIHTPRLTLRRFTLADAPDMFCNWASDPEVTQYLTWPAHGNEDVTRYVLGLWEADYEKPDNYQWAIELEGQPIGSISAVHLNEKTDRVEIGYCIGRQWWNQRITTEALRAVIGFFFERVGANRVDACHDIRNPASGAVMRKAGMKYEGIQRQAGWNNLGRCDLAWYAILASDRNPG